MKKNFDLAEIIKEAVKEGVLEAFAQMYGVTTTDGEAPETPDNGEDDNNSGNSGNNNNNGNNSGSGNNSGGGPIEPIPNIGIGGLSLDSEENQ